MSQEESRRVNMNTKSRGLKRSHRKLSGVMRSHDESKGAKMRQKGQEESRMI